VGIERVAFVTLTFPDNCEDRDEAQGRFHSFYTNFLRRAYDPLEFIAVPERQERGAFHYHLATAFPCDVRTGFNFDACAAANKAKRDGDQSEFRRQQQIYFESANDSLRGIWRDLRSAAPRYQFGRCETLPVLSNAQGLARYVGAYVTTASSNRQLRDKGLRTVRYSLDQRAASIRWSWADGNGRVWRRGFQLLGQILELDYEKFKEVYGEKVCWKMRGKITLLGHKFDDALPFVAEIPDYADWSSRVRFLGALLRHLGDDDDSGMAFLELQAPF